MLAIDHRGKDGYYKCLLRVPAERLLKLLADATAEERSDDWFQQLAIADGGAPEEEDMVVTGEDLPVRSADLGDIGLPGPIPVDVSGGLWTRCVCRRPGAVDGVKVYFDAQTGGSGRQRGWAACTEHGCRLYRFCDAYA